MRTALLTAAATLVWIVAVNAAPAASFGAGEVCAAPRGISRVSTLTASCCASLPCHRPLSFGGIETRKHVSRT